MFTEDRLRCPALRAKIGTPDDAAALIEDGMNVGFSGFTPSGYPKATALALAGQVRRGRQCRINVWTGASVGPEIEEELAAAGAVASRAPYYAASNKSMRRAINAGEIEYTDLHLSHFAQQIDYGFYGPVDVAVVEASAVTPSGDLILGPGVGNTPILVKHARKVIVEINTAQPLELEGMHDIYIPARPPYRREIPIYAAGDRIGVPAVACGSDRIACVLASDIPDKVRNLEGPGEASRRIAGYLIDFLRHEQRAGRLPDPLPPLQSGVGSIANAVLSGIGESDYEQLAMYSEILQDAVFDLIDSGKVRMASGCAFTPSPRVLEKFRNNPDRYRRAIVLRPLDISNHPEVIRRLGVIALNTPLEFDIYGNANSTHTMGTQMMNGIGGSGDYMRNGYLTVFTTEATAHNGAISRIVPMVSHPDHTEHDTMVFITEWGVADVRGLGPRKRARLIIEKCAHPDYRPLLFEYLEQAERNYGGHMPQDLEHAFDFHRRYQRTGTMRKGEEHECLMNGN